MTDDTRQSEEEATKISERLECKSAAADIKYMQEVIQFWCDVHGHSAEACDDLKSQAKQNIEDDCGVDPYPGLKKRYGDTVVKKDSKKSNTQKS